ncbi:TPA: hypothetical protein QDA71_002489 [Burkholderia vietnamiensis]|uniref:hypothetical protein n=1 Tax=Burkholderia sp. LMG 13014 TaxID=2709306 RepID=UPI001963B68F|nr:hypothetical protein [Burkholderia sp. LMG 13014]HDR8945496.1 hypothetical protein [Burkholderia vietnamiensis]HDR9206729.1 hypothetical protein [Burkholderia vietnamiensis]
MSRRPAPVGLSGYVARKDRFKRERAEARTALRRVATAYRVSVSASAASLAVTVGIALSLAAPAPAGCRFTGLTVFCVVEAVLAVASITASLLLHRQADRITERLTRSTQGLVRARARLVEMRSITPSEAV